MTNVDEIQYTECNIDAPAVDSISVPPRRPYRLTVELPLFLTMLAITIHGLTIRNIVMYRTCVHALHHDVDECKIFLVPSKSNTAKALEDEVQMYYTYVSLFQTVVEGIGPAVLSLFLGVWSDTYGRKPLMVWTLFGLSASAMTTTVYAMMDNLGPWWSTLAAVPITLTGGITALFTGAFTYISDISTRENTSLRMTVLEVAFSAGGIIGAMSFPYLAAAAGNACTLLVACSLYVAAYVHTNVCLEESLSGARQGGLSTVLDLNLVREMLSTCFSARPNRGRARILLLTLSNSLVVFILYGIGGLTYMYTREKLQWSVQEYSVYSATSTLVTMAGALVGVKLVSSLLGDLPMTLISYLTSIVEYLIITFAVKKWQMYLGCAISMFKGLSAPLIRSHLTKSLPSEDIAKVFALLCAMDALCPLVSPVLYNALYAYTITTFPGAVFLLSAGFTLCCFTMVGLVQYFTWKYSGGSYQILRVGQSA